MLILKNGILTCILGYEQIKSSLNLSIGYTILEQFFVTFVFHFLSLSPHVSLSLSPILNIGLKLFVFNYRGLLPISFMLIPQFSLDCQSIASVSIPEIYYLRKYCHHDPLWTLSSSRTSLHWSLSKTLRLHPLTPKIFMPSSTSFVYIAALAFFFSFVSKVTFFTN